MYDQIAFVKTGWAERYTGELAVGRHAHIGRYNESHERFNFVQSADGRYYGYLPPIGGSRRPPQPRQQDGWLVLFVAANLGGGPLTVVGWYEDAFFEREFTVRPEYKSGIDIETDSQNHEFIYCVSADTAKCIPVELRETTVPGDHFKRTPIVYARGNGVSDGWREELAGLAERVVSEYSDVEGSQPPSLQFPDKDHRDQVEEASVKRAWRDLEGRGYRVIDKQAENAGYDLLAKREATPTELHVEVKGTSGQDMRFFMSRNEERYMNNPKWRLCMVTDALNDPVCKIMTASQVLRTFDLEPYAWEAKAKPSV